MQRSPNIPPIIVLPRDTTASDALLHDILNVLKENKAYQLAVLEQQNQLHDSLEELNRSLLTNREKRHTEVDELSLQVDGLREDLNRFFVDPAHGAKNRFKATPGMGRWSSRRPRRVQTPRPRRRSPDLVADSASSEEEPLETDIDPNIYRYSEPAVPIRGSYTPAPTYPRIPSTATGTAVGSSRTLTPSNNIRPESRQQSSQGSSGLTYVSDDPVIPPPPPGFVPYPDQDPMHRQNPLPTPRVPFQQSPLHPAPAPPPPHI
ncbi:hypothetical protein BDM02DRAFT_745101 [Thelephora ganbajun]|uniref:Uncharacterized protein n=1 Tax=Thelephora ganbajun TaxID=370292 RepID=A0ACB6ZPQ2_THEGA|nr:hypothetical protein BDM02DRAFT_745101 [Thelephora ganbajun]